MRTDSSLAEHELSPNELGELLALVKSLRDVEKLPSSPAFYDRNWPALEQLPAGLRRFFAHLRRTEASAAGVVHGFPVDDGAIGPTPDHWEVAADCERTLDHEIYLGLCGMALGEPFTWASLQSARIVQNILPIAGDEQRQNGYGSDAPLAFHTEDAFHPDRCDYLLLFGLRNDDRVPTTVAAVRDVTLSTEDREVLMQRRFHILPDHEHIRQLSLRGPDHPALREMLRMRDEPERVAVLFGHPDRPYLRIDQPFMSCVGGDPVAERALGRLIGELERVLRDVVVGPGTLLVVDNYAAAHGRRSFRSRYDGTDRWLKKITVRRDLRRWSTPIATTDHRVLL
jgi:Fe(II)/alpha-ketoglutarate-dependent arginine beta-hydroxylase